MKKKIAILNFHYSNNNYGAVIQAYCLQEVVTGLGYEVKTINYLNFSRKPHKFLIGLIQKYFLTNPFEVFRKNELRLTKTFFWHYKLKTINKSFDTFIVGSDQVWRYFYIGNFTTNLTYYLDFVEEKKKKIAYAVSFGKSQWPELHPPIQDRINNLINNFDAISVREISGIGICKNVFKANSTQVLDPTLLIDSTALENLALKSKSKDNVKNKIVYYKLDPSKDFFSLLEKLKIIRNTEFHNIYFKKHRKTKEYYDVYDFLKNIKDSNFVVTDSFHCICFCIAFKKEFFYYPNFERGVTRVESLFKSLEIKNRILYGNNDLEQIFNNFAPIDYFGINKKLEILKEKSINFLINNI